MSKPVVRRIRASEVDVAHNEPPQFAKVVWYKEPHLRKLYAMSLVLMIASSTTGYDGSLINTSQQIQLWRDFFGDAIADNNKLGILVNMFNIGSIVSFFFTPYVADHFGRRIAIIVGCIFMVCGGCMTAFCDGYTSMSFCISSTRSIMDGFPLTITSLCRWSILPGLRKLASTDGIASSTHRNLSSTAPWPCHCDI